MWPRSNRRWPLRPGDEASNYTTIRSAPGYTAQAMRAALLLVISLLLAAAAALAQTPPPEAPALELPRGDDTYVLRSNPCGCLSGAPELDMEVQTALGWERVAVENAEEEEDVVTPLRQRFRDAPDGLVPVHGVLTNDLRIFGDQHASRVLRLVALDPAP